MTKSWIWCCPVYLLNVTCIRDKAALACAWWISFPTRGEISRESESQISIRGQLCSNLQGGGQILILSSLARCFATHSEGVGCISLWNSLYVLTQGTVIMTTDERLQKKTNCTLLTQASFSALFLQSRGWGEEGGGGYQTAVFTGAAWVSFILYRFSRSASANIKRSFPTCCNQHLNLQEQTNRTTWYIF